MKGHHRFLRTKAGKCYFAQVWVQVEKDGETVEVGDALPEHVDLDAGEANGRSAPAWVAAALEGIRATLAYAQHTSVLEGGCRVELNKLVGSVLDTREDVLRCAAGLALWEALGSPDPAPEVQFDGQEWSLNLSTRVASPVQEISQ